MMLILQEYNIRAILSALVDKAANKRFANTGKSLG